jgi:peroxiredoxin
VDWVVGRKRVLGVFTAILLLGLAWWAGTTTGELLTSGEKEKRVLERQATTAAVLKDAVGIKIGSKWPDMPLQDLNGDWVYLSKIVTDSTLVIVIQPGCEACEAELDALKDELSDNKLSSRFIIISDGYPLDLIKIRDQRGIKCLMLTDRDVKLFDYFKTMVFPTNLFLGPDITIMSIEAGHLTKEDIPFLR